MPAATAAAPVLAMLGPLENPDGSPARQNGGTLVERLAQMASVEHCPVAVRQVEPDQTEAELVAALRGAQVIIPYAGGAKALTTSLVEQLLPGGLRLVQLMSAGFDHIDVAGLAGLGVPVANNGGSNAIAVAEHAIGLLLSFYRRLPEALAHAHGGGWSAGTPLPELPLRREINGKTIGIVGFGNVGRQMARRLAGFDVELLYYDPLELPPGRDRELLATATASLDELLGASDIVTLHVPLDRQTRGMIGAAELRAMRRDAVLINTCRGPVVDEPALAAALRAGEIGGAVVDVTVLEPIEPDSPLLGLSNCMVTPHIAGDAAERGLRESVFCIRQVSLGPTHLFVLCDSPYC
eukprot:SAG22_NODE_609_length_8597_cov_12.875382_3_plen_352_part_00